VRTPATADSLGQCLTGQNNRKLNATILNAPKSIVATNGEELFTHSFFLFYIDNGICAAKK